MGNSSTPERVHPIRDAVEVVIEQARIDVERHRRRGMAEHRSQIGPEGGADSQAKVFYPRELNCVT